MPTTPQNRKPRGAHWPPFCVPVAHTSVAGLLGRSADLLPEHPFQEFRLDALEQPLAGASALPAFLETRPEAILLATCRRVLSGGRFRGDAAQEARVLGIAAAAGCALVDLALETAEDLGPTALAELRRQGAQVVLSWHDFTGMGDLRAVLDRMRPFAPDLVKIVPTAHTLGDNVPLLRLLQEESSRGVSITGMAMDESGVVSRILGHWAGSEFTYAPATAAEGTAPGQMDVAVLRNLYRAATLEPTCAMYGVAGDPIRSSLSPLMLNTAFHEARINAVYMPLLARETSDLMQFARNLPLSGFSVTMPLKQAILPLLDRVDTLAERIGAVNTVRREQDGTFSGFNTDAAGITVPLSRRLALRGARILVLGAGGAARAAVFACADAGAQVSILNRTYAIAAVLAGEAGAYALKASELGAQAPFDVLIQATPAGMRHHATGFPSALPEDKPLPAELIFDLVYNPQETALLQAARRRGHSTVPGMEMFVHQGARQFELWTGQPAPVEAMHQAVEGALAEPAPQ